MTFTKSKLSLAVSSLLLSNMMMAGTALAQTTETKSVTAAEEATKTKPLTKQDIEVIEVSGYRASVQKSLNMKRFSDTIVDAVSAEDVGQFPDQTVADALQRIPGVQIERESGEGDRVSIRGTAPHLNLTLLNGQSVASATGASILNPSRGFNYSLLPAEMIDTLEVFKSAEADIDEGSVGGTVVVNTRKPLNTSDNYFAFSIKDAYQENPDEHNPYISGLASWKNEDETFGANFSYVHKENITQRDGDGVYSNYRPAELANGEEVFHPYQVGSSRYESEYELDSISTTLQYRPTQDWDLTLTGLYSERTGTTENTFVGTRMGGWSGIAVPTEGEVDEHGNLVKADVVSSEDRGAALYSYGFQTNDSDTLSIDLKSTYSGDNYEWTVQGGYSEAEGRMVENLVDFDAQATMTYDLTGDVPVVTADRELSPEDYKVNYAHINDVLNEGTEKYIQTDYLYYLDNEYLSSIKTGIKYREHEKSSRLIKANPNYQGTLGDFTDGQTVDNWEGQGATDNMYVIDNGSFDSWVDEVGLIKPAYEHLDYAYDIVEKISAAYVKANIDWEDLRGNIGVRYVETEFDSTSWESTGPSWRPENITENTVSSDYSDFLPSLNLKYDYSDELVLRFAAAKVMSRPDYEYLSSRQAYDCNDINCVGKQGNPDLDPYRADQFDLSAEWYFNSSSVLSFAYFFKDIETYITYDKFDYLVDEGNGVIDPATGREMDATLTTPYNGEGGTNQGYEINYQQDFGMGFGAQANYTYSDADMDQTEEQKENGVEAALPNNSEDTFNLAFYYENEGFRGRIAYNMRSAYYYQSAYGQNYYKDDYQQIDLNTSFAINDKVTVMFQVMNLTDETQESYMASSLNGDSVPMTTYEYGRRVMTGFTVKL